MLICGKIAPRKEEYVQKIMKKVDLTPWKYANPISAVVVTTLVYIYVLFSPLGIVMHGEQYGKRFLVLTLIYFVITITAFVLFVKKEKEK